MAGTEGFEPPRWLDQNQLPYHLATSQYLIINNIYSTRSKLNVNIYFYFFVDFI